jgi:magnesium-transporting ATPase (P-type)
MTSDTYEWHAISHDKVMEILDTSPEGLSSGEVTKRIKKSGRKRIQRQKEESVAKIFFRHPGTPTIHCSTK